MKIRNVPGELLFKIRLSGKQEGVILLHCLNFGTNNVCIPTARLANKKESRLGCGLLKDCYLP